MKTISIRITDHRTGEDRSITVSQPGATLELHADQVVSTIEQAATGRYIDNGDGTVTDTTTGLMWSRDNFGDGELNHEAAGKACAALRLAGHADWRLPTRAELLTLVDDTRHDPCIDTAAFPSCRSSWYWTATPAAWSASAAWLVYFSYGGAYGSRRSSSAFVRAVRAAPAGQ